MRTRSTEKSGSTSDSVISSPGTSPVVNIHIHMHSPIGTTSKTVQPIVHLHLDSLTKGLLPSIAYPNPPISQNIRGRKRVNSPSITLDGSQYNISMTSPKKYGKRKPRKQANNTRTLDSSLDSFNPIYTSSQTKWNSTDNLTENIRICDGVLDVGDSHDDETLLNNEDVMDCNNLSTPKSAHQNNLDNQTRKKESESDSSRSNLTQMSLRSSNQVQKRYSNRSTRQQRLENRDFPNTCVINEHKEIKLKEAVVVLKDIYKDKTLAGKASEMRITQIVSLLDSATEESETEKITSRTVNGKKHSEESHLEFPYRKDVRNTPDKDLNGSPVALSSDEEYQSPSSLSDSESQSNQKENGRNRQQGNKRESQSNLGQIQEIEVESSQSEVEDLPGSYNLLLNVSRKNGGLYSQVYSPEKKDKKIVIENEALSIMDGLNFTELRQVIEARETGEEIRVSCKASSGARSKETDATRETVEVVSNGKEPRNNEGEKEHQEEDDDQDDDSDSDPGRLEVDLTIHSEIDEPEGSISAITLEESENGADASETQACGAQLESQNTQMAQSPPKPTSSTSESKGEIISKVPISKKRRMKTIRKKRTESPSSSSSSSDEEEKRGKMGRWKKHFFSPDLVNGTTENRRVSDRMEPPEISMNDLDEISEIGVQVSSQLLTPQCHERLHKGSKSPEKPKESISLRANSSFELKDGVGKDDSMVKDRSEAAEEGIEEAESSSSDDSSSRITVREEARQENGRQEKEALETKACDQSSDFSSSSESEGERNHRPNGEKPLKHMERDETVSGTTGRELLSSLTPEAQVHDTEKESVTENPEGLNGSKEGDGGSQRDSDEKLSINGTDDEDKEKKEKKNKSTKVHWWDAVRNEESESSLDQKSDGEYEGEKNKKEKEKHTEDNEERGVDERPGSEETTCNERIVSGNIMSSGKGDENANGITTSLSPVKEKIKRKEDTKEKNLERIEPESRCLQKTKKQSKRRKKMRNAAKDGKGHGVSITTKGKGNDSNNRKKDLNDNQGVKQKDDIMGQKSRKIKKPKKNKNLKRKRSETETKVGPPTKLAKTVKSFKGKPKIEKGKSFQKSCQNDNYLSLDVAGPTKFAVANLEKLKPQVGHDVTTLKERLLFGDRVKRFPSSKSLVIGKMKQKAGMSCTR